MSAGRAAASSADGSTCGWGLRLGVCTILRRDNRGVLDHDTHLATGGGGKTIQCTICHGADLKGLGNVPGLAGRSAIYVFRQLYDIQHGTRKGNAVALMQPVVAKLTQDDMIALASYVASRNP